MLDPSARTPAAGTPMDAVRSKRRREIPECSFGIVDTLLCVFSGTEKLELEDAFLVGMMEIPLDDRSTLPTREELSHWISQRTG